MSRLRRCLLTVATFLLVSPAALAWGPEGHAIVADIAQRHLDPAAARAVAKLLALQGDSRLDQISSWADQIRKDHPKTGPWHYVDIPLAATAYKASRDCPHGACVVAKLPHFAHVLADRKATPRQRLRALKWVVHLVGDIHQPLHAEDHDDWGGNKVKLVYFGHPTNLHRMWDTNILERALHLHMAPDYSFDHAATRVAARHMDDEITAAQRVVWAPPRAVTDLAVYAVRWAEASHRLARVDAYPDLPAHRAPGWSAVYQSKSWPLAKRQLEKAGVRLADVLNAALD